MAQLSCRYASAEPSMAPLLFLSSFRNAVKRQHFGNRRQSGASSSFRSLQHVTSGALSAASSCSDRPCRAAAGLVCRWSTSSDRREHGTFNHNLLISGPHTEAITTKTYLTFKRLFGDITSPAARLRCSH